jgi:alpha-tubulin suppressor-like RCC1 family protein
MFLIGVKFEIFQNGEEEKKEEIAFIEAGDEHTVVLTNRGRVFTCGSNDFGQV